jgi:hypothetical protein
LKKILLLFCANKLNLKDISTQKHKANASKRKNSTQQSIIFLSSAISINLS